MHKNNLETNQERIFNAFQHHVINLSELFQSKQGWQAPVARRESGGQEQAEAEQPAEDPAEEACRA